MTKHWIVRVGLLAGLLTLSGSLPAASAAVYSVFSDKGHPGDHLWVDGSLQENNGDSIDFTPPEGQKSFYLRAYAGSAFWGVFFDVTGPINLSAYDAGELRFWLRSSTGTVKVELEYTDGTPKKLWTLHQLGWNDPQMNNNWTHFRIPLSGVKLSNLKSPWMITLANQGTIYVDHVRYVDTTALPCSAPS